MTSPQYQLQKGKEYLNTNDINNDAEPVQKKKTDIDPSGSNNNSSANFATLIRSEDTHTSEDNDYSETDVINTYGEPVQKKKTDIDPGGSNDDDSAMSAKLS